MGLGRSSGKRQLLWAAVAAAALWHTLTVVLVAWPIVDQSQSARDFNSFYYATQVAHAGGDPYDLEALRACAEPVSELSPQSVPNDLRGTVTRLRASEVGVEDEPHAHGVYPFLYPPPFLLLVSWTVGLSLTRAFEVWFWIDELLLWVTVFALWRWSRRSIPLLAPIVLMAACVADPFFNNRYMGQMNVLVLALTSIGWWLVDSGTAERRGRWRPFVGGVAVGVALTLKMAPMLFVVWWVLRKKWRAVIGATAATVVLFAISTAVFGEELQRRFFGDILPGLLTGHYHQLDVPVGHAGNLAPASLLAELLPQGAARIASVALSSAVLVGVFALLYRRRDADALSQRAHAATLAVTAVTLPSYVFQHHLVWLLAPVGLTAVAIHRGWLSRRWAVPLGLAWATWLFGPIHADAGGAMLPSILTRVFHEAKHATLWLLLAATLAMRPSNTPPPSDLRVSVPPR